LLVAVGRKGSVSLQRKVESVAMRRE